MDTYRYIYLVSFYQKAVIIRPGSLQLLNVDITLVVLSLCYGLMIIAAIYTDHLHNRDKLSAVKLIAYFSVLEWFSMFWFSFRTDVLHSTVLKDITWEVDTNIVYGAYLLSLTGFTVTIIGAIATSYRFRRVPLVVDTWLIRSKSIGQRRPAIAGWFILLVGTLFYSMYLYKIGGISFLWQNLAMRTTLSAGLGYYQILYNILCITGGALISLGYLRNKRWVRLVLLYFFVALILVTSGSRWYMGLYTFILVLIYHFNVRQINKLLNRWTFFITLLLLAFMLLFVQLRAGEDHFEFLDDGNQTASIFKKVEADIIKRFGVIERQVVVIDYFEVHELWLGASYTGLLKAYQLRSLNPDKPPVDTGVYLKALADGFQFTPPVAVQNLQATSWPEGNLAGYMNFGLIGYLVFSLASGMIFGVFYHLIRLRNMATGSVIIFGFLGFMGAPDFSPYGLFELIKLFLIFSIMGWVSTINVWQPTRTVRI